MAVDFKFRDAPKREARLRQFERCACKGEKLNALEEHAHHVFPQQSGSLGNPQHAWLSTSINCVILCTACHERVHEDGRYRGGAVAPPSYYPHSHGGNIGAHGAWVKQLTSLSHTLGPGWK
jgi:hypothetical protein